MKYLIAYFGETIIITLLKSLVGMIAKTILVWFKLLSSRKRHWTLPMVKSAMSNFWTLPMVKSAMSNLFLDTAN